jgi:hypothetical protein
MIANSRAVTALCMMRVRGGWLIWNPVALTLLTVYHLGRAIGR